MKILNGSYIPGRSGTARRRNPAQEIGQSSLQKQRVCVFSTLSRSFYPSASIHSECVSLDIHYNVRDRMYVAAVNLRWPVTHASHEDDASNHRPVYYEIRHQPWIFAIVDVREYNPERTRKRRVLHENAPSSYCPLQDLSRRVTRGRFVEAPPCHITSKKSPGRTRPGPRQRRRLIGGGDPHNNHWAITVQPRGFPLERSRTLFCFSYYI